MQSRNLAARAGRWSAQHRRTAILGWILFVVLAAVLGGKVGLNDIDESESGNGESKRGDMIVAAAGFPDQAGEQVLVQGKGSIGADDPRVAAAVKDVVSRLQRIDGITEIESPLDPSTRANTVSDDGRSVVVNFTMPGTRGARREARRPAARRGGGGPEASIPTCASRSSATCRPPGRSPPRTPRTGRSRT